MTRGERQDESVISTAIALCRVFLEGVRFGG
jgi:hypothetical protein